jgi:AraC-like DNA-binding protein
LTASLSLRNDRARRAGSAHETLTVLLLVEEGEGVITHPRSGLKARASAGDAVLVDSRVRITDLGRGRLHVVETAVEEQLLLEMTAWMHAGASPLGRARVRATFLALHPPLLVLRPNEGGFVRLRRVARRLNSLGARPRSSTREGRRLAAVAKLASVLDPLVLQDHPSREFAALLGSAVETGWPEVGHPGVRRGLVMLMRAPAAEWSVAMMAHAAGLSIDRFARVFSEELGCTPRRFLAERRLAEFILLIETSPLTVSQAARAAGWSSPSHAIAAFRAAVGVSPAGHRSGRVADADADADETDFFVDESLELSKKVDAGRT